MNDYVLELPDFKYDRVGLFDYQARIEDWSNNYHFNKGGYDTSKVHFYDYYPQDYCNGYLSEIFNQIDLGYELFPESDTKFSKLLAGGKMPFHIDPQRSAVLMLPLTDDPAKLEWRDAQRNFLYEHEYKCPTLINAQILHGVPHSLNDRIFLQIKIMGEWSHLLDNYKTIFKM